MLNNKKNAVIICPFWLWGRWGSQELLRELCKSNGNGSIPINSSSQPNQSVEVGSTAEEPVNSDIKSHATAKEKVQSQGCGLSSVKEASRRAASVFIVENPHNIDRRARTVFPTAFLFVNILYWLYYLFLWVLNEACRESSCHHPEAALPPHFHCSASHCWLDLIASGPTSCKTQIKMISGLQIDE